MVNKKKKESGKSFIEKFSEIFIRKKKKELEWIVYIVLLSLLFYIMCMWFIDLYKISKISYSVIICSILFIVSNIITSWKEAKEGCKDDVFNIDTYMVVFLIIGVFVFVPIMVGYLNLDNSQDINKQVKLNNYSIALKSCNDDLNKTIVWSEKTIGEFADQSLRCIKKLENEREILKQLHNVTKRLAYQLELYKNKYGNMDENNFKKMAEEN